MLNTFFTSFSHLITVVLCLLVIQIKAADITKCRTHQEAIKSFYVENRVAIGTGTTLRCFISPSGKLVNLKWYVNDTEFYRYEPTARNHVKHFRVKGVRIDETQTQFDPAIGSIIRLTNLTYLSSKFYKCEVTTEPCFETVEKRKQLIVVPTTDCGRTRSLEFNLRPRYWRVSAGTKTRAVEYTGN